MQNKESVIKTIKDRLSVIHTAKKHLYYLGESRATERADLKNLYLFDQIERDGREFLPEKQFYILQHFMQKDKKCIKWDIADKEIRSLSPEQLSEEYCNFVAEETKKAIRERIEELDEEIEVEKVEKNIEAAKSNGEKNKTPGSTQGSTPGNTAVSDNSTISKAPEEVHLSFGSFKRKRPSSSILDGTPPKKKRVRFAGAE